MRRGGEAAGKQRWSSRSHCRAVPLPLSLDLFGGAIKGQLRAAVLVNRRPFCRRAGMQTGIYAGKQILHNRATIPARGHFSPFLFQSWFAMHAYTGAYTFASIIFLSTQKRRKRKEVTRMNVRAGSSEQRNGVYLAADEILRRHPQDAMGTFTRHYGHIRTTLWALCSVFSSWGVPFGPSPRYFAASPLCHFAASPLLHFSAPPPGTSSGGGSPAAPPGWRCSYSASASKRPAPSSPASSPGARSKTPWPCTRRTLTQ